MNESQPNVSLEHVTHRGVRDGEDASLDRTSPPLPDLPQTVGGDKTGMSEWNRDTEMQGNRRAYL